MKTILLLSLLFLPVVAQEKPKSDTPKKPAEHQLSKEELTQLAEFREFSTTIETEFKAINAELDKVLTDAGKIAVVTRLQLARRQNADLQSRADGWVNDLKKKYRCASCIVQGDKFVEQPKKD